MPGNEQEYEAIAVKAYRQIDEGDASGFRIQWEFLTDVAVHDFG